MVVAPFSERSGVVGPFSGRSGVVGPFSGRSGVVVEALFLGVQVWQAFLACVLCLCLLTDF